MEIDSAIGRLVCVPEKDYIPVAELRTQADSLRADLYALHEAHADIRAEYSRLRLADVRELWDKLQAALGSEERAIERACRLEDLLEDCRKRAVPPTTAQIAAAVTPNASFSRGPSGPSAGSDS